MENSNNNFTTIIFVTIKEIGENFLEVLEKR